MNARAGGRLKDGSQRRQKNLAPPAFRSRLDANASNTQMSIITCGQAVRWRAPPNFFACVPSFSLPPPWRFFSFPKRAGPFWPIGSILFMATSIFVKNARGSGAAGENTLFAADAQAAALNSYKRKQRVATLASGFVGRSRDWDCSRSRERSKIVSYNKTTACPS